MTQLFSKYWWTFVLRGVLAMLLGLTALLWSPLTLDIVIFAFGVFVVCEGLLTIIPTLSTFARKTCWALVLAGSASLVTGCFTFLGPWIGSLFLPTAGVTLAFFIAGWAVITGILEITAAIRLRKEIQGEWTLGLSGVASMLFGLIILSRAGEGALAVAWMIGPYGLLFGILLTILGLRVRSVGRLYHANGRA
jgi:uncharacterized membrane protein HdeD (DUF308 family)